MQALSAVYGAAAGWRRRWYARHPARSRRLAVPVVSVGNLRVGGTGKTPTAACIARLLQARGERPVILTRGYGREKTTRAVTVVSDLTRVLAGVAESGDEPLLLARALPGVPVLVCADRHRAGRYAEAHFAPTVHLLDDGFQHLQLARDVDLLLVDDDDLSDEVLPAGRLREPLSSGACADAVIVPGRSPDETGAVAARLGVPEAFALVRTLGTPRTARGSSAASVTPETPLFAVAGIARPDRFFSQLEHAGFRIVGTRAFKDHHVFSAGDLARIAEGARAAGASVVVTTEKDAVRLETLPPPPVAVAVMPLQVRIEPEERFAAWLTSRLAQARAATGHAS